MHGPRGTNEDATFALRIAREKLDRLRAIAHGEHRSINSHLKVMIDREIAEHDERTAAEHDERAAA